MTRRDAIIEVLRTIPVSIEAAIIYAGKAIGDVPVMVLDAESIERITDTILALPRAAPTKRELHDTIATTIQLDGLTYSAISRAVDEIQRMYGGEAK